MKANVRQFALAVGGRPTCAAVEEGILPGGGALLRAVEALKRLQAENEDQKHGVEIVRKALETPARQIAINTWR
jgi:chaperonin GroEL